MKNNIYLFLLFTVTFVISCSRSNPSNVDGLPVIDVTKKYPEKEIMLNDIADVTYVHLDSKQNDFLYKGTINYVTENTIVVVDVSSGSILFFSKEGNPKSRFNRYGNGPEEYFTKFPRVVYDETTDDVFIISSFAKFIQVYSSKGVFKRKLIMPSSVMPVMISEIDSFDDQSLIVFDEGRRLYKAQPKTSKDNMDYLTHTIDSSYFLISKKDGQVLDYIPLPFTQIDLFVKTPTGTVIGLWLSAMVKHSHGFLLCNPELDTVFLYSKNKELTPIICKTPLVSKLEPKIILNNCIDVDKYQFMEVQTVSYDNLRDRNSNKYYIRDKKTGEVYQQKIVLRDYMNKKITISPNANRFFLTNTTIITLDMFDLMQAYRENKLSRKLKELVGTLDKKEENDVYMFVHFK